MKTSLFPLLALFCCCFVQAAISATVTCNGVISGVVDTVVAPGPTCTLSGATVTGSVSVTGGDFSTEGTTQVFGSISAETDGDFVLGGNTTVLGSVLVTSSTGRVNLTGIVQVSGEVSVSNSPTATVVIGPDARLNTLSLEMSGQTTIQGLIGTVECKSCGSLRLDGAELFPGGLLLEGTGGALTVCSSNITGSLNVVEGTGSVSIAESGTCGRSTLGGSILIAKGGGNVRIIGATLLAGDFIVEERAGAVTLQEAVVGDISVSNIRGAVTISAITTESDAEFNGIMGALTIDQSVFAGDVSLTSNTGFVRVTNSSFSLENVEITNTVGRVLFTDNRDASVSISENEGATIRNNTIIEANVEKNTVSTVIEDNNFQVLKCSDNVPPPVGARNTVSMLADGQCAGF